MANALERIRQLYAEPKTPICPKCSHQLTVDKTEFFETEICENCFDHATVKHYETCCSSPSFTPVKYIISNGGIQVRNQCKCGHLQGNSLGGYTQEQKEKLPLADLSKRDNRQEIVNGAWKHISEQRNNGYAQIKEKQKADWMDYYSNHYLQSPEWKRKRELVLIRDRHTCQCCLNNKATQVHHKSYEFVDLAGSEPCFDLVAICKPCHDRIEEMKKQNRKP